MSGAPVKPRAPPTTSTAPAEYLVSPGRLPGAVRPSASTAAVATSACGGMPISATATRPEWLRPGSTAVPSLRPWKHTVTSAVTAPPATTPVEASTPEGTSSATIPGSPAMAAITAAASGLGRPWNPVPSSASTITPARCRRALRTRSCMRTPRRAAIEWFRRASSGSPAGSAASKHSTSHPAVCRWRATTKPSPPLLPPPQTTAAVLPAYVLRISWAAARPARSMSTAPGMPISVIAPASAARISPASYSGRVRIMPRRRRQRPPPSPSSASC